MIQYGKIFIFAFLLDGIVSFIDTALEFMDVHALTSVRMNLANVALLFAVIVYLSLAFSRKLPKRVFLPLCLFLFWTALYAFPLPFYLETQTTDLLVCFLQMAAGLGTVYWELKINKGTWQAQDYPFSFKYSGLFVLAHVVILPFVAAIYVYGLLSFGAQSSTAGFMRLSPTGLYLQERHYRKDDKSIRLVAMIHIGNKDYYQEQGKALQAKKAVILAEGVSDSEKLLQNALRIDRLAEFVGLSTQHEMTFDGNFISTEDLESRQAVAGERTDIVAADIDAREFAPETLDFLRTMGEHIENSESAVEWLLSFYQWSMNLPPRTVSIVNYDILDRRNQLLLHYMSLALLKYDTVVIPWGAMHMPEFERAVLDRGFSLVHSEERLSMKWTELAF